MYPDFQYISFHEQSDRLSLLEGKVFQYGWIFLPFSFFTENWKAFITSILMKTAKDLEIIRGDIHIRICKHPYHTSVDLLYETNKVADQPGYRTFLSAPLL